jgi:hypothetical protein
METDEFPVPAAEVETEVKTEVDDESKIKEENVDGESTETDTKDDIVIKDENLEEENKIETVIKTFTYEFYFKTGCNSDRGSTNLH